MQLNEVKAIITGGVSGLGLAVARKIVAAGGQAVLLDINNDGGAAAIAELGDAVSYRATPRAARSIPPASSAPAGCWDVKHRWRWITLQKSSRSI